MGWTADLASRDDFKGACDHGLKGACDEDYITSRTIHRERSEILNIRSSVTVHRDCTSRQIFGLGILHCVEQFVAAEGIDDFSNWAEILF